jgi:hypothetical protein
VLGRTGAAVGDAVGNFCGVLAGVADEIEVATGVGIEVAGLAQDENRTKLNNNMTGTTLTRLTNIEYPS